MLNTIKLGSNGIEVQIAQYLLGYAARKQADTNFDQNFSNAVIKWQTKYGINADGIIGPTTWSTIAEKMPTCSTSKNKTSAYTCAIQLLVGKITVDGIYGNNTKKAVVAYQSACGLKADGICGQKTWHALIVGKEKQAVEPSKIIIGEQPVNYKQYDSKWKNIKYSTHTSSQTIGNSGCGPTAMADIVATWWNKNITPVQLCELSVANGYRTYNSGTAWGFFKFCADKYGAEKFIQTTSITTLKAALQEGAYAIVSFGPSKWTSQGHFCCIWKWDGTYFHINDPASSASARAKGTESEVLAARKQFFIFYNKQQTPIKEVEEPTKDFKLDGKIIDISKWQGNIDFNTLAKEVSLVIARAGVGSDADPKFDEYAQAMAANGIPFGVYCYSYAGTDAKAKDEAQKLVSRAKKYNPLFYVLDAEEAKLNNSAIKTFAKELRAQGAKKIGCYVANHRYNIYDYDSAKSLYDFTWIPSYGKNDGTISGSKKPSYPCDLWQYSSTAKVKGINGNVDINIITGEGHDLKWFLTK